MDLEENPRRCPEQADVMPPLAGRMAPVVHHPDLRDICNSRYSASPQAEVKIFKIQEKPGVKPAKGA